VNPIVSVIIPTYNVELYIKKCLDSVLNQTYHNIEVLVVDDCSTDSTVEILNEYNDSRLKISKNNANMGPSFSRNSAIKTAKGEWIAILDGDDWWEVTRLEKLISAALTKNADMVIDDINFVQDGEYIPWQTEFNSKRIKKNISVLEPTLFINKDLGMKPIIKRKMLAEKEIYFDESLKYGEDYKFYLDCLTSDFKCVIYKEALYFYRSRKGSLMTKRDELIKQTIETTKQLVLESKYNSNDEVKKALQSRYKRLVATKKYYNFVSYVKAKRYKQILIEIVKDISIVIIIFKRIPKIVKSRYLKKQHYNF